MEETNTSYIGIKYSIHSLRIYIIYNHCSVLLQQPEMSGHFCKIPVLNYLWGMGSCDMMIKFTANHRVIQDDERKRSSQGAKLKLVHKSPETHLEKKNELDSGIKSAEHLEVSKLNETNELHGCQMREQLCKESNSAPVQRKVPWGSQCQEVWETMTGWHISVIAIYVIYSTDIYYMYTYIIYTIYISYIILIFHIL